MGLISYFKAAFFLSAAFLFLAFVYCWLAFLKIVDFVLAVFEEYLKEVDE